MGKYDFVVNTADFAIAKMKSHNRKKAKLGDRLQVLRTLIRRYYKPRQLTMPELDFIKHCEAVLDNTLAKYDYKLEEIIDKWRTVVPKLTDSPMVCSSCTYRPPFCRC